MARNKSLGMHNFLSVKTLEAAQEEANKGDTIQLIDVDRLVENPYNNYELTDIDLLAGMIASNNFHIETLEVTPAEDDKFMIIAGHRRNAAWHKLLESGLTDERRLPCHVRYFEDRSIDVEESDGNISKETLTADMQARYSLILSNLGQRQKKSIKVQLWEVQELEPLARLMYRQKKQEGEKPGTFRSFFANYVLKTSTADLQRKKNLLRLSDKAQKAALEDGLISLAAASILSGFPPEEQDKYIEAVLAGEKSGTRDEIQEMSKKWHTGGEEPEENDASRDEKPLEPPAETPAAEAPAASEDYPASEADEEKAPEAGGDDEPHQEPERHAIAPADDEPEEHGASDPENKKREPAPAEPEKKIILHDIPVPEGIFDPQEEADNWYKTSMLSMAEQIRDNAEREQQRADYAGNAALAAQWGMRKEKAKYEIAKMKES